MVDARSEDIRCVVSTSDWHLGDGSPSDDFNEEGTLWVIETGMLYRPIAFCLEGDIFENWQARLREILQAHERFFKRAQDIILSYDAEAEIWVTDGNHDPNIDATALALYEVWPRLVVRKMPSIYDDGLGWRHMHGYQFDPVNRPGWFRPIAHGLTWFAGRLENLTGGFNESRLDPRSWVSPAHDLSLSARGDIQADVLSYAQRENVRVVYGHTHEPDISRNRRVVNCGCCCNGRASAVALFSDGNVNLIERMK